MRIAILGAPATGKTRLARDLAQHLPALQVTDSPPLMNALPGKPALDDATLQTLAQEHQCNYDLTLLTGLDLSSALGSGTHSQQEADGRLRATLQQAGIAYGVVYGSGPQRLHNALRLIEPQDSPQPGWTWMCEKCSDPDCEYRLFTGLRNLREADLPPS